MGRLLDSNAVKKALYDAVDDISLGYYVVYGIGENDIERIIDSVPSAQPEPKTCVGCVHENQKGWCIDVCGECVRNSVDHYEPYQEESNG